MGRKEKGTASGTRSTEKGKGTSGGGSDSVAEKLWKRLAC